MLASIKTSPKTSSVPKGSPNTVTPKMAAMAGLTAQNNPARAALTWLCAMGCKVKPKPVHTIISMASISHCEPDCGSCGVSVSSMAKNESTPMVPTCTMPMPSVAVLPCERRSVTIIAAA